MTRTSRVVASLAAASSLVVSVASCGDRRELSLEEPTAPSFLDDAGTGAEASAVDSAPPPPLLCPVTECPAPYATCKDDDSPLGAPTLACQIDLRTDPRHCGKCNQACPTLSYVFNAATSCVAGQCRAACISSDFADCNGVVDDGCEASLAEDPSNCGACGVKCAPGVRCREGRCGCSAGLTQCGSECVDTKSDDNNCGTCGQKCKAPFPGFDAGALPPNTYYGCDDGKCPKLKCRKPWSDCNNELSDGCEVNVERLLDDTKETYDPRNCGACGRACAPNQLCIRPFRQRLTCICGPGRELCSRGAVYACAELETDPVNCGSCGFHCPGRTTSGAYEEKGLHGQFECKRARCSFDCRAPWSDCNNDDADGCEANLLADPNHCGTCGARCAPGQLCLDGRCAVRECEGGIVR